MMKITAICFVLFANMIILAHAVVPHYHLPNQVIIIIGHNVNGADGHRHHSTAHDHDDCNANNHDYCLLYQLISTPTNGAKQVFRAPINDFNFGIVSAILVNNDFACNPPPLLSLHQTPCYKLFYTCYVNSVSGLRAPPTV
jgi:hypothetical protein